MSIDLNKAVVELSLIPAGINHYTIYKNPNLHIQIAPANDVDLQGIRISSEHAVIILGYCLSGDGIECRVYTDGGSNFDVRTLRSTDAAERKANINILIGLLEGKTNGQ